LPPSIFVAGIACSKGASGVFDRLIPRVGIAVAPVGARPSGGGGAAPAELGGQVKPGRLAAASKPDGIVGGFLWSFFPNPRLHPDRQSPYRRSIPLPGRARASAQG